MQATGIQRAYPDMPAAFMAAWTTRDLEKTTEDSGWEEESGTRWRRPGG